MRLLTDQNIFEATTRLLKDLGHDVLRVSELGLSRAEDDEILRQAHADKRLLITRDRDFGALAFSLGLGAGVLYLRLEPSTLNAVHREMELVLGRYSEAELASAFVVIEPGRHRYRRVVP